MGFCTKHKNHQETIQSIIDGQVNLDEHLELMQSVNDCAFCSDYFHQHMAVVSLIKQHYQIKVAPIDLAEDIRESISHTVKA